MVQYYISEFESTPNLFLLYGRSIKLAYINNNSIFSTTNKRVIRLKNSNNSEILSLFEDTNTKS